MKIGKLALALAASLAAASSQAQYTMTYNWTEIGSSFGDGNGTITVDELNEGADNGYISGEGFDFNVDSISGTINGDTLGYFMGGTVNFLTDTAPTTSVESDFSGFDVISSKYVFEQYPTYEAIIVPSPDGLNNDDGNGTFTLSAVPAPEPGALALAGAGSLSLLVWRRRK